MAECDLEGEKGNADEEYGEDSDAPGKAEAQWRAVQHKGIDEALREIIGQSHSPDRRENAEQAPPPRLVECNDDCGTIARGKDQCGRRAQHPRERLEPFVLVAEGLPSPRVEKADDKTGRQPGGQGDPGNPAQQRQI